MRAVVREFGLVSGLRAVGASLLRVRGTDRDVKGGVRFAQGTGEDIRGPQVGVRNEPSHLHLCRAVAGLSGCAYQRDGRVVTTRSFTHRAGGGVGLRPCQANRSGRQHRARVHKARRTESTYSSGSITFPWCG